MKRIADDEREDEMDENLDQVYNIPNVSYNICYMLHAACIGWIPAIGTFETFLWGYFFAMKNTENDSVNQAESADIKILIQFSGSRVLKIFSWNFKLRGWVLYA